MPTGRFLNQKLAKRSGHAQRRAKLAVEAEKERKPNRSSKERRAIIGYGSADLKAVDSSDEDHSRS
ncbi:MAG: hypothetical protein A3J28_12030 [Acidobacteria bacterium RIFCSPLOWO2_12_FULL_60_22]|nr:MAG: hypothetical protein A3J28_12030 [Acidobacteria bacterium RIFCSPLOWO2_12_FULL_60_22]